MVAQWLVHTIAFNYVTEIFTLSSVYNMQLSDSKALLKQGREQTWK
jgi:hypothetical protein